ncbi:hypothetical protein E2C01_055468 [Portunus trituberculatus]|uniref:Uncharacterized protein n=1 Tax=Portunus trituberculatus TaxID=210409 RepID=A0A5B7GUV4_PORTR|nr:hypothetical protein [Portunus trituberculatus]
MQDANVFTPHKHLPSLSPLWRLPTHLETVALSEEAQPTLRPWTGFEPVRLKTPRTPKHAWFHCTTAAHYEYYQDSE